MSRTTLKPIISKIREIIIKDISGKMEKYGFNDSGIIVANKPLSEYHSMIKNNLVNLFEGKQISGNKKEYIAYIQDSARTFLHIIICFKTMEKRGLISNVIERLLKGNIYDAILPDFNNVSPIAFTDLSNMYKDEISKMEEKDNFEEDREYYNFIFMLFVLSKEMSNEVPLLFRDYEHNLVQPDFDGLKEILFNINKIEAGEYFEDDFLGWIYQYWVDIKDDELKVAKEDKEVSYANLIYCEILKNLEEEQTQYGEFYTPRWVVKYIVDNALKPYYEENKKIETIKLLDPACGAGNFLVYAFDVFYDLYKEEYPDWPDNHVINNILGKNIFGVDIQREPLQITALNLWLKAKKKAQDVRIKNLNLFNMNILKANSLYRWENDKEEILQMSLFQTEMELTEKQYTAEDIGRFISSQTFQAKKDARLFFRNKFNIIVMNPPFVDARKMDAETSEFLKKEYPNNARNLFSAFIQRAIELTVKKGVLGFISSDTFLTISSFSDIRKEILSKTISLATLMGHGVFDGPTVSATVLVLKNCSWKNNEIMIHKVTQELINDAVTINIDVDTLSQEKLYTIKDYPFIFRVSDNFRKIFSNKSIGDYENIFEVRKGVVTANNNKFLKYKWEVPSNLIQTEFLRYNKEHSLYSTDTLNVLDWRSRTKIEIMQSPSSRCAYILDNFDEKTKTNTFKQGVVFSLVGHFKCSILKQDLLFDVGTPAVLMNNDKYQLYMLCLLNSNLYKFLTKLLNSTVNNTPGDIRRLPFKIPSKNLLDLVNKIALRIIEIMEYLLGFNYVSDSYHEVELEYSFNYGAKTVKDAYEIFANRNNELENELYVLQLEIDHIVNKIYELNQEDIAVIEEEFPNIISKRNKDNEIKKVVLSYIRAITKDDLISRSPRLYTDEEIEVIIKKSIENNFENGYSIVEEIEAILERPIIDVIRGGVKIGSSTITLAGKGSKDLDEPLLQQKVLSGTGTNKKVVIWHLSHFLLEFDEDKKYVMQNEIRKLSNDIYRPRLQTIKEKLRGDVSSPAKKEFEKQEKLLADAVKTLEAWKVIE